MQERSTRPPVVLRHGVEAIAVWACLMNIMNSHSQLISAWQQGRCAKNTTEGNVLEMRQGPSLSIPCQRSSSLIFVVHYAFMNDLAHQYSQFHYRNYQCSERISLLRNNLSKLLFSRPTMCSVSSPENKCLCAL